MIRAAVLLAVLLVPSVAVADTDDEDRQELLDGIDELERSGVPGKLVVFGDEAFAVVAGGRQLEPIVAAARYGKGRVVAMAHSGYIDHRALVTPGNSRGTLLTNALTWTSRGKHEFTVGIVGNHPLLAQAIEHIGFEAINEVDPKSRHKANVLVWLNGTGDAESAAALGSWVRRGGGLITAACPWGWAQLRSKEGVSVRDDLPENVALRPMGLAYSDGSTIPAGPGGYPVDVIPHRDLHAGLALADMVAGRPDAAKRAYLIESALRALPPSDSPFVTAVEKAIGDAGDTVPTAETPIGVEDTLARLAVTVRSLRWRELAPENIEPAPGVHEFPGAVPTTAERVSKSILLDPSVRGWVGTGLYLAPGEVLTVRVSSPSAQQAEGPTWWGVQIGCHSDKLWQKDTWKRWPEITHGVSIDRETTTIATPFVGLVYFYSLDTAPPLTVEVEGAVESPRFVLGDADSEKAWPESRMAPGPWAEIEGHNLIVTVPSETVRLLDDPKAVAEFWDAVVASHCTLAATRLPRTRERFVADIQISVGYMHSGYPIMMHLDQVTPPDRHSLAPILDVDARKTQGSWGYFHELGHNRQRRWWTFNGTGEVTCNLFSLYTHEMLCDVVPWENEWLEKQKHKAAPYLAAGAPFAEWRRQPGLALIVYAQIQREFGWAPFIKVFADYEALDPDKRPTDDQDKIDQFVLRLSHATGHDLRPLWQRWGAPLSNWVKSDAALNRLPDWMPNFDDLK